MIRFLIKHPVSVIMAFVAAIILSLVGLSIIPVSLLPDMQIPFVKVKVDITSLGMNEAQSKVAQPLMRSLIQASGVKDIDAKTTDGECVVTVSFDYGTDANLAFVEINERIDAALNEMPPNIKRPQAIKCNPGDLPVLFVQMTLKEQRDENHFLEMSEVASEIIRRRLEQLQSVDLVDITGIPDRFVNISLNPDKADAHNITINDIQQALSGIDRLALSSQIQNSSRIYNLSLAEPIDNPSDLSEIPIRKDGCIFRIGDIADISVISDPNAGQSFYNGKRAVTMSIIKNENSSVNTLKDDVASVLALFADQFPDYNFHVTRDQSSLLQYSIDNLTQSLLIGLLLIILLTSATMGNFRNSLISCIVVCVSLIVTFLFFYLFKISINIISLSGLILAVGMMIDNSIVITENISQYREFGLSLDDACHKGATEMITPLLSSTLTTVAVFLPLIFLSGISGVIFADQAFSITSGLTASYIVGIGLLPVVYHIVYKNYKSEEKTSGWASRLSLKVNDYLLTFYQKGWDMVMSHRLLCLSGVAIIAFIGVIAFESINTEKIPAIKSDDTFVFIEWNNNGSFTDTKNKSDILNSFIDNKFKETSVYVGRQTFDVNDEGDISQSETVLYLRADNPAELTKAKDLLAKAIDSIANNANVRFEAPPNLFERVFGTSEAFVEARIIPRQQNIPFKQLQNLYNNIDDADSVETERLSVTDGVNIMIDPETVAKYDLSISALTTSLQELLSSRTIGTFKSHDWYLPIHASYKGAKEKPLHELAISSDGYTYPVNSFVSTAPYTSLKQIQSNVFGQYIPIRYDAGIPAKEVISSVDKIIHENPEWDVSYTGTFFSDQLMVKELVYVLGISLLMMYFILCIQFGSFVLPVIVLLEIPIDVAFTLLCLMICGVSLNLMSCIGIIVTCGVVINDSILKIDSIQSLQEQGTKLRDAVHIAGVKRLRAIVMTSLTTIFALVPSLFMSDMGSQLQRPLNIAIISSMIIGTLVSLFIVPLLYILITRKSH